jgi:hypothetical protein
MEDFWSIVKGWTGLGQGVFFLLLVLISAALIEKSHYYIAVMCRGWPRELEQTDEE